MKDLNPKPFPLKKGQSSQTSLGHKALAKWVGDGGKTRGEPRGETSSETAARRPYP